VVEEQIILEGTYNRKVAKEYLGIYKDYRNTLFKSNRIIGLSAYVVLLTLRLLFYLDNKIYSTMNFIIDSIVVIIGFWIFLNEFIERKTKFNITYFLLNKRRFEKNNKGLSRIRLQKDGVFIIQGEIEGKISWGKVQKAVIHRNAVLLFTAKYKFNAIPRSFASSEKQWNAAINIIISNLNSPKVVRMP
jgi:hypothetical protein